VYRIIQLFLTYFLYSQEENKNHDLRAFLDELSNATPETSIKVRVARMWDTLNLNKQKGLISTDMVLIDEKVLPITLIMLFIPSEIICADFLFKMFCRQTTFMLQHQGGIHLR
jgi:hypothetical protein